MKRTISAMVGKGSLNHNSRKFHAENVDPSRSHLNIEYCNEDIRTVYHELFDEAVTRYNEKQKRSDRKIDDYYEKICSGKQEKPFHEIVIQIGNKDDCACKTADGDLAAKILDEYMLEFQKRNPVLRVFSAHLHLDEATPHLHIDFVPYITGSKRGVDTRVSLKQALSSLGFKGGTRSETEWNQWANAEKEQLALVMQRHGIEWEKKGTHEEHLSVLDYKKKERTKEVQQLEMKKQQKADELADLGESAVRMGVQLIELNAEIHSAKTRQSEAEEAAQKAEETRAQAQSEADRLQKYVTAYEKDVWEYEQDPKWQLSEAGALTTGKTYRDKKALPLVNRLKKTIKNLTLRLIQAESEIRKLRDLIARKTDKIDRLERQVDDLTDEADRYLNRSKALGYVERAIGRTQVEQIVIRQMEREEAEQVITRSQRSHDISL